MSSSVSRLLAPAGGVAAVLITCVASSEIPDMPDMMHAKSVPFLYFASHPSMPLPPVCRACSPLSKCPIGNTPISSSSSSRIPANSDRHMSAAPLSSRVSLILVPAIKGYSSFGSLTLIRRSSRQISGCIDGAGRVGICQNSLGLTGCLLPDKKNTFPIAKYESTSSLFLRPQSLPSFTFLPYLGKILPRVCAPTLGLHVNLHTSNSILIPSISRSMFTSSKMHPFWSITAARSPILQVFNSHSASPLFHRSAGNLFPSSKSFTPYESLYVWHSPPTNDLNSAKHDSAPSNEDVARTCSHMKPAMTVVLLGWLGAQQKHLKKYAEWYLARGIHAVTFVIPMRDLVSFKLGHIAEEQIDHLADHIATWLKEEDCETRDKVLLFHTFSNTGWLTYGVILERLLKRDRSLVDKIKGCVVDSAPVAELDPQVWASGFFAALMKKSTVTSHSSTHVELRQGEEMKNVQPPITETAILAMLEKFFSVLLQLPYVKQRLSEVVTILSQQQPHCPQLYIYSSADRVIPVTFVETFIDEQRRAGHIVRACNLYSSPHVDHYRSFPEKYSSQLNSFIEECLPQWSV